jgi:hypothetical protein
VLHAEAFLNVLLGELRSTLTGRSLALGEPIEDCRVQVERDRRGQHDLSGNRRDDARSSMMTSSASLLILEGHRDGID